MLNRRFTVAPMLDWTDKHCRYFHRLLSHHAVLYTEMVTTGAILHGNAARYLGFNPEEQPLALQLGGSEPHALAQCARIASDYGYSEINLNVGCPSDRVQRGAFGACLMAEPQLIADCIAAMQAATNLPITVKNRIGIDDQEDYAALSTFVETVAAGGCHTFIVHARKAWLNGLSPKENRDIPPLRYELVHQLKQEFPHLEIVINGGLKSLEQCQQQLQYVDGVMVGREAYQNPWLLAQVDPVIYGVAAPCEQRMAVLERYMDYVAQQLANDVYLHHLTRPILGLFQSMPGAKRWRRHISEQAHKAGAGLEVLKEAARQVQCEKTTEDVSKALDVIKVSQ